MTRKPLKDLLRENLPILALALVIVVFACFLASRQKLFFTPGTAADLFKYYSPLAMLALGMTFVILTGGIDLSVGFVMMLLMFVMAAYLRDHPTGSPAVAMVRGLGTGLGTGAFIGWLVAYVRIPAFIATLAAMVAAYGVNMVISKDQSIGNLPDALLWLGGAEFKIFGESFRLMALVVIAAFIVAAVILGRTKFGRYVFAIGSNREAARLSGINVPRTELCVYVIMGFCAWVAALMQIGINRSADPKVALTDNLELNAIAIVVIGGTSLVGGRGRVLGTAMGALLLALVFYGLPLINIGEPSYKKMILGGIILLGAVLDAVQRRYWKTA